MNRVKVMEMVKNLLLAVAMVVAGVLFMISESFASDVWLKLIVWAFAVIGAYMIVHYFVNMKELHKNNSLILGIMLLFAGLYMVLFEFYEFILYFYPLFLAVAGGLALAETMQLKKKGCKAWWQPLILAIIQLVLAVMYVLLWRFVDSINFLLLIGIALILDGIYVCVAQFVFKHECKKVEKAEE